MGRYACGALDENPSLRTALTHCLCGAHVCHSIEGAWWTHWNAPPSLALPINPGSTYRGDFRDIVPPTIEEISAQYHPVVRHGEWTVGLFDMWRGKLGPVKHATHIPCWHPFSYGRVWRWRGACGGRTFHECIQTGLHNGRIARAALASDMTPELTWFLHKCIDTEHLEDPTVGTQEKVAALFNLLCCLEIAINFGTTFGIGFLFSLASLGKGPNCAACLVCHVREKFRRKCVLLKYYSFLAPPLGLQS